MLMLTTYLKHMHKLVLSCKEKGYLTLRSRITHKANKRK